MITVRILGPKNETADIARQVKQLAMSGGKVVRHWLNLEPDQPIPPCDVAIIEREEK